MHCLRTVIISLVVLVGTCAAAEAAPTDENSQISLCLEEAKGDAARERTCIDRVAGPCMQSRRANRRRAWSIASWTRPKPGMTS